MTPEELLEKLQIEIFGPGGPPLAGSGHDMPNAPIENPYWSQVRQLPTHSDWSGWPRVITNPIARDRLVRQYSFAIPAPREVLWLAEQLRSFGHDEIVEVGAGTGYWAWQLAQAGMTVHASDTHPPAQTWHRVDAHDAVSAAKAHPDAALMLVWPPLGDPMARQALAAYKGDTVVYNGEFGGCTADSGFHTELDKRWDQVAISPHHITYKDLSTSLTIYRRPERPAGRGRG